MQKFQYFLFVLKLSYICYYIICMTVPLKLYWTIEISLCGVSNFKMII